MHGSSLGVEAVRQADPVSGRFEIGVSKPPTAVPTSAICRPRPARSHSSLSRQMGPLLGPRVYAGMEMEEMAFTVGVTSPVFA